MLMVLYNIIINKMLEKNKWWSYLESNQQELLCQSFYLLKWARNNKAKLHDYSFIAMPAAKAFEGFLKKWLFDLQLINKDQYEKDYFRIGKALNPELRASASFPKEFLFQDISYKCGEAVAQSLWQTWKNCRNRMFHYFAQEQQVFTLKEAEDRLNQIIDAIDLAFTCL